MHEKYTYSRLFVLLGASLVILVVSGLFVRKITAPDTSEQREPLSAEEKIKLLVEQPDESATTSQSDRDNKMQLILQQPDESVTNLNGERSLQNAESRSAEEVEAETAAKLQVILQQPDESL